MSIIMSYCATIFITIIYNFIVKKFFLIRDSHFIYLYIPSILKYVILTFYTIKCVFYNSKTYSKIE